MDCYEMILKKGLLKSLELEKDLVELIEECLIEIFKDKSPRAIQIFLDGYSSRHDYGCIPSLATVKSQIYLENERAEERRKNKET